MSVVMYNKNRPLLHLKMNGTVVTQIIKINKENASFLPINLQYNLTLDSLNTWIVKRLISNKRDKIEAIREEFPLFENYDCMFSLSDQYWFKYRADQTWEKLNFFTNSYTEDVGKLFFSPWEVDPSEVGFPSPDLTTNGVLMKAWRKERGVDYLYKAGSDAHHQQPISEVLASLLLKKLDFIPFVEYDLDIYGLKLCSKCANFVDEHSEFVPASHIYYLKSRKATETIYNHFLRMCKEFGLSNVKDYLDKMIAADKIIGNNDRHLGNFGFIRNVETGKITRFAPLFDSGSSFYGVSEEVPKSKIFEEESHEAVKRVMRTHDLGAALDHSQMFDLIDKYPDISWSKKQEMKERILQTSKSLKKMTDKIQRELKKEQDPQALQALSEAQETPILDH